MDDLTNFRKTLRELGSFVAMPVANKRDVAGIIQAFELTFEQAWKAIQKTAARQGVEIGNPKSAFTYAMENHWIDAKDEEKWLSLLKDRNLTSHTYEEALAQEVLGRLAKNYVRMFEGLLKALAAASD